jgi:hypothetical protein
MDVVCLGLIAGKPAPTEIYVVHKTCGSGLARDEAGTVNGELSGIPARRPYNARLWYIIRLSLLGKYR